MRKQSGQQGHGAEVTTTGLEGVLTSTNFDSEAYARRLFESERAANARDVHAGLARRREEVAKKLKADVFKNYQLFLATSREIANLESDVEKVRELFLSVTASLDRLQDASLDLSASSSAIRPSESPGASTTTTTTTTSSSALSPSSAIVKEIDWLTTVPDEVELALSRRKFVDAVRILTQVGTVLRKNPAIEAALRGTELRSAIDGASRAAADALAADSVHQGSLLRAAQAREPMSLLVDLGQGTRAGAAFLAARSAALRKDVSRIRFEGDILRYVRELSRCFFGSIADALAEYSSVFPSDGPEISRFTQWASAELERSYCETFNKRVFYSEDFSIVGEAIQTSLFLCSTLLPQGFDLSFAMSQLFVPFVRDMIDAAERRLSSQVTKAFEAEDWTPKMSFSRVQASKPSQQQVVVQLEPAEGSAGVQATSGIVSLATSVGDYLCGVCFVLEPAVVHSLCVALQRLIDRVMGILQRAAGGERADGAKGAAPDEAQRMFALADGLVLAEYVVPRACVQVERRLQFRVAEMRALMTSASRQNELLQRAFCARLAADIVNREDGLDWPHTDYRAPSSPPADAAGQKEQAPQEVSEPSRKFTRLFQFIGSFMRSVSSTLHAGCVEAITKLLLEEIANELARDGSEFWKSHTEAGGMGKAGIRQLFVDMRFFIAMADSLLTDHGVVRIESAINRATKLSAASLGAEMPTDEWAQKKAIAAVAKEKTLPTTLATLTKT